MNKLDIKKVGLLLILIGIILLIISIGMIYDENKMISRSKAVIDKATIIYSGKISSELEFSNRGPRILMEYNKKIVYRYIDYLEKTHEVTEIVSSIDYKKISERYLLGETIEITYDKNNPDISIIGKLNSYILPYNSGVFILYLMSYGMVVIGIYLYTQKKYKYIENNNPNNSYIYTNNNIEFAIKLYSTILLIFIILIFLYFKIYLFSIIFGLLLIIQQIKYYIYSTKQEILCLEVIDITHIDYERETVIFKDENGIIYQYATDFGEYFKNGEKYELVIKMKNLKKEKIRDSTNSVIYNIINIEKNKFSKI